MDVWSAGVILYILLCGYPPFSSEKKDAEEIFAKVKKGTFEYNSEDWQGVSASAKVSKFPAFLPVHVPESREQPSVVIDFFVRN